MRFLFIACSFLIAGYSALAQTTADSTFRLYKSSELPAAMGRHGSCVIGTRLYIIGGEDSAGRRQKTFSAEIQPSGQLGPWREELPLPEKRAGLQNALTVVGKRIYIVGGMGPQPKGPKPGSARLDSVIWTEVKPDGTLQPWQNAGPCPSRRRAGYVVCSDENYLYVLGGKDQQPVADIMSTAANPDGSLPEWKPAGRLPIPLADHGAAIMDGRMYVWGGITTGATRRNTKVFSTAVSAGATTDWREETALPGTAYETVCIGYNDYLLAIGGRDANSLPSQAIWQARLDHAQVKSWQSVQSDLAGQLFMSAAIDRSRGWVFVSGGRMRVDSGAVPVTDNAGEEEERKPDAPQKKTAQYKFVSPVQAFVLTQPQESKLSAGSQQGGINLPGLPAALQQASTSRRPVLLLLYSPEVPGCKRFWDAITASAEFPKLQQSAVLAAIDVMAQPEALQKYTIYKLPAVVTLSPDGTTLSTRSSMRTMEDLKQILQMK
jgi:hypothetical protein